MVSHGTHLSGDLHSSRTLLGCTVENPRGENLGKIEDIMISAEGGQIAYAVVSFGGLFGLGRKLFAFPWSALHVVGPREKVILNLDKKTLAETRGFDKDHWPASSDWTWDTFVPFSSREAPASTARASVSATIAPQPIVPPAIECAASAKNRMEQWGKSWQSHGLDRP